jgi:hypothetical protein
MPTDLQDKLQPDIRPVESSDFSGNRAFAPALLDPDLDIPAGIVGPDGNDASKRFSVYRNNVVSSLIESMAQTYPAVKIILGEENFATVARIFIAKHPPTSPVMQAYGELFPEFLGEFKPLQHSPFLVDLANVEKNWIAAYHAADANILNGPELADIEPDVLMETRFTAHPATSLITSQYCLYDLFSSRREENRVGLNYEICQSVQAVLITRPQLIVEVNKLDHANAEYFNLLFMQRNFGQAVEAAIGIDSEFNISSAIALMLTSGAMTKLSTPGEF